MKWFRLYGEVLNDPKVQKLHPKAFKAWISLLCLANEGTPRGRINPEDISYGLRMDDDTATKMIEHLLERGLLEREGEALVPHNWDERQFASDNVTERSRQHRRNVARNVSRNDASALHATPPDTDTETDTEQRPPKAPQEGAVDSAFGRYWALVVRKEPSRAKALEAWDKAIAKGADPEQIIAGMRRHREAHLAIEDATKIPHATTWLNQQRWTADPTMPGDAPRDDADGPVLDERDEKDREARVAEQRAQRAAQEAEREAERAREQERIAALAAEQEATRAQMLQDAIDDPERPPNVAPDIWANIHPERRPVYAARARRMLELEAEDAAREAAREATV